ncbi:hypothetical protein TNCV_3717221 [Trichonephila clavipes]|nr:hypothetical protein TNCV_3717221 [Trichonephila clavipes]
MDGDHLLQCTGLNEFPTDDIVSRKIIPKSREIRHHPICQRQDILRIIHRYHMKNACFSVWEKASTYSPLIVRMQLIGGPLLVSDPYLWHDSRPSSLKANRCSSCSSHHPSAEGRSVQPHGAMTSSHMFTFGSISHTGSLY